MKWGDVFFAVATIAVVFIVLEAIDRINGWLQWRQDREDVMARVHRQETHTIQPRRRAPYDWTQER